MRVAAIVLALEATLQLEFGKITELQWFKQLTQI